MRTAHKRPTIGAIPLSGKRLDKSHLPFKDRHRAHLCRAARRFALNCQPYWRNGVVAHAERHRRIPSIVVSHKIEDGITGIEQNGVYKRSRDAFTKVITRECTSLITFQVTPFGTILGILDNKTTRFGSYKREPYTIRRRSRIKMIIQIVFFRRFCNRIHFAGLKYRTNLTIAADDNTRLGRSRIYDGTCSRNLFPLFKTGIISWKGMQWNRIVYHIGRIIVPRTGTHINIARAKRIRVHL